MSDKWIVETSHENEIKLRELMQAAEVEAALLMQLDGSLMGQFFCEGAYGSHQFKFTNPRCDAEKTQLFNRVYFNCLACEAEAAVMFFEGQLKGNEVTTEEFRVDGVEFPKGEVLLLDGESRDMRVTRALPIERSPEGRFESFGPAWEMVSTELKMGCGIKLEEWNRAAALDQAGNFAVLAEIENRKKREVARGRSV